VVARTRVIQPRQGMGERPFGITSSGKLPVATSQSHSVSYSSERISIASQQAKRYQAGYDVCSELASHDACVSLPIDHMTRGPINVLVFEAIRFDTAYHYSVAFSHEQRFGID
jgi:hypothetical protein